MSLRLLVIALMGQGDEKKNGLGSEAKVSEEPQAAAQTPAPPDPPVSPWSDVPAFEQQQQGEAHTVPLAIPPRLGEPRKSGSSCLQANEALQHPLQW